MYFLIRRAIRQWDTHNILSYLCAFFYFINCPVCWLSPGTWKFGSPVVGRTAIRSCSSFLSTLMRAPEARAVLVLVNGILFIQAHKTKRQGELFHVSKLAHAICQRTSSYTPQMRHLVQIIAASMHWAVMKLSTMEPVPTSTTLAVTDAMTWGMPSWIFRSYYLIFS